MICTIPAADKNQSHVPKKPDDENKKNHLKPKIPASTSSKPSLRSAATPRSQSSSVKSVKSFATVSSY